MASRCLSLPLSCIYSPVYRTLAFFPPRSRACAAPWFLGRANSARRSCARGSCCILMLQLFLYEPCTLYGCMDALTLPQCLCGMSVLCVNSTAVHVRGTCMHGHARWTGPQRVVETASFGGVTNIKRCACTTCAYIRSPVHIPRRDTEILN